MQNTCLRFYVTEKQRHSGAHLHDWLLQEARKIGIPGGSAYRAIAGYGRHGQLHEETFFELGGEMPVQVEFILGSEQADAMLEIVRKAGMKIYYVRQIVESGVV